MLKSDWFLKDLIYGLIWLLQHQNWKLRVVQFRGNRARNFKSASRCALGRFEITRPITP